MRRRPVARAAPAWSAVVMVGGVAGWEARAVPALPPGPVLAAGCSLPVVPAAFLAVVAVAAGSPAPERLGSPSMVATAEPGRRALAAAAAAAATARAQTDPEAGPGRPTAPAAAPAAFGAEAGAGGVSVAARGVSRAAAQELFSAA